MKYCYCTSCKKTIKLKNSKPHLKSQEHMDNQGLIINFYTVINPELCELNSIIKIT